MNDPRLALRATYAQWLRVRANVRALGASLAAAEHTLKRDARRDADPDLAVLTAQIACERSTIDTLAAGLDTRIAEVKSQCDAIETAYREELASTARRCPPSRRR